MGRGAGQEIQAGAALRRGKGKGRKAAGDVTPEMRRAKALIERFEADADRAERRASPQTIEQRIGARSRGLGQLTNDAAAQKKLIAGIKALEEHPSEQAQRLAKRGRELFMLCHAGLANQMASHFLGSLENVSDAETREILLQEARIGLNRAIDHYQDDKGANPATYAKNWMRAMITERIEAEGRAIRVKSKAHDALVKLRKAAKELEQSNEKAMVDDVDALSKKSGLKPDQVRELLPHINKVALGGGMDAFGFIPAPAKYSPDTQVIDAHTKELLRQEVQQMRPLHARVISALYGLDGEDVEQKDLFEGVYRDAKGNAYSAEPSVIAAGKARGEKVTKATQRKLNELYKAGELTFEPWTEASAELALLSGLSDHEKRMVKAMTVETGIPMTSGTVQEAKRLAEEELARNPRLAGLAPRYRGPNELENSGEARVRVARALVATGALAPNEENKLVSRVRAKGGGKAKLRELAEEQGLVDPETGTVDRQRLDVLLGAAPRGPEDFAALMSSAPSV